MFLFSIIYHLLLLGSCAADFSSIRSLAADIKHDIRGWRRDLHKIPELNYMEFKTSAYIKNVLDNVGLNYTGGWGVNTRKNRIPGPGGTGIVANVGTGAPPYVALRADFDGLPITESTPVAFKSETDGLMHACGHDGHTSMLLGAGKLLKKLADEGLVPGTVRLIFQPAEEGGGGAARMVEEGALQDVSRIFGLHLWPELPSGTLGGRSGYIMGGEEDFEFVIVGRGSHGAMPHQGIDPIVAGSAVVQALQMLVSRELSPLDSAVVSITMFQAGHAYNSIPKSAKLGGTIRALDIEALDKLKARFVDVVKHVVDYHRCELIDLLFSPDMYPPVKNDPAIWSWLQSPDAGVQELPLETLPPTFASEDFSFYTSRVPGLFLFLGIGSGSDQNALGYPTNTSLHNPGYNMDEDVLPLGSALHAQLALRSLAALQGQSGSSAVHAAEL
eukprot:TRINITY_DN30504_c0_g1_i1.p1 TRINITY_DN30504_c0_g1~~TRINITY_DN30504_c0_g1_i1.p1  ORF type:complete len:444 (-),score=74.07 TRINITY_DN30504_c0_g1_i1:456-1787(-)